MIVSAMSVFKSIQVDRFFLTDDLDQVPLSVDVFARREEYLGPFFANLSADVQWAFLEYLESIGIGRDFAEFVEMAAFVIEADSKESFLLKSCDFFS